MKTGIYLLSLTALFFAACGSDSGTDSGPAQAETVYGLGECEIVTEGVVKFVVSDGKHYTCRRGAWQPETEKISAGNDGGYNDNDISSGNDKYSSSSNKYNEAESSSSQDSAPSIMEAESEYDAIHNTLRDLRDGKVYRTMVFGGEKPQIWMAENLNYFDTLRTPSLKNYSWCYKNDESQCNIYGRFYAWEPAMDACPRGWHLPSYWEWETLVKTMGGDSIAGQSLSGVGFVDKFVGFTTSCFYKCEESEFKGSNSAQFWSATPGGKPKNESYRVVMTSKRVYIVVVEYASDNKNVYTEESIYELQRLDGLLVRCIKDTVLENEINPPAEYDASNSTMKDMRDGKVYRTTQIGDQIWMAENLNYSDSTRTPSLMGNTWQTLNGELSSYSERMCITRSSGCIEYFEEYQSQYPEYILRCIAEEYCTRLGLFYSQKAAGVACPLGWHLPYDIEWEQLIETAGGYTDAAISLRTATGWEYEGGLDSYGFSALPLGYIDSETGFSSADYDGEDNWAYFWGAVHYMNISTCSGAYCSEKIVSLGSSRYVKGASVRCIKNRD